MTTRPKCRGCARSADVGFVTCGICRSKIRQTRFAAYWSWVRAGKCCKCGHDREGAPIGTDTMCGACAYRKWIGRTGATPT